MNQLTNGFVHKQLEENAPIYIFFKLIHNSQSTITQIIKDNKFISKILDDLSFVGYLYVKIL